MNQDILKYQKLDGTLIRMERELKNNDYRKKGLQLTAMRQEAEDALHKLDTRTIELKSMLTNCLSAFDDITVALADYQKAVGDIADIDELRYLKKKIVSQLESLEACDRNIKNIIRDAEDSQSKYNDYSAKLPSIVNNLNKCNEEFSRLLEEARPQIKEFQKQQSQLEGSLEQDLLANYKQMRSQNIFPVFVQLEGKSCGGCRMELTAAAVSQVNTSGQIKCEHCHRIIYQQDK